MSFADFKDNTMRAVVSKTIDGVLKYGINMMIEQRHYSN